MISQPLKHQAPTIFFSPLLFPPHYTSYGKLSIATVRLYLVFPGSCLSNSVILDLCTVALRVHVFLCYFHFVWREHRLLSEFWSCLDKLLSRLPAGRTLALGTKIKKEHILLFLFFPHHPPPLQELFNCIAKCENRPLFHAIFLSVPREQEEIESRCEKDGSFLLL